MTAPKLLALRQLMKSVPNLGSAIQAYIIPTDDAHQSEYICDHDQRRKWISGFDGSAGTAVVTEHSAHLWTDGRYYEQAAKQLDENWTLMKDGQYLVPSIGTWLAQNLPSGSKIGVDPLMMSYRMWTTIQTDLNANECHLLSVRTNLIDQIWTDQPPTPDNKIVTLHARFAGETINEKVIRIRQQMQEKNAFSMVATALDEVAWFMNLRGADIDYNPVFFSYLIITHDEVHLFVNKDKLPSDYEAHLKENDVHVILNDYECIEDILINIMSKNTTGKIWISPTSNYLFNSMVDEKKRLQVITAIETMKAIKNSTEIHGLKQCHIRDGKALCQYFAWLQKQVESKADVDEITGAIKLEEFRSKLENFYSLSFGTISGFGPNGSIIHYSPKEETKRKITDESLYLCDSGAQFYDGTTDVTRTWHFGASTLHQRQCFTRVLKGQIQMGTQIFPANVKGFVLDTLARKFLWDVGLDYGHGTGHGIGHFLNVHEGPMGIGTRAMPDDPGLSANMFLSNEPGYYEEGEFGIRIEDIVVIVPAPIEADFAGRGALTFETVTMCPIQTKLIEVSLLTEQEVNHINDYHDKVLELVGPLLQDDPETLEWLKEQTQHISK